MSTFDDHRCRFSEIAHKRLVMPSSRPTTSPRPLRWSIKSSFSAVDWALMNREARMVEEQPLRAAQAARKLGIPTKELLRLVYERKIRYVMVDGIAHVPIDAVEEYRSKAS
jgi:hypothetical protein